MSLRESFKTGTVPSGTDILKLSLLLVAATFLVSGFIFLAIFSSGKATAEPSRLAPSLLTTSFFKADGVKWMRIVDKQYRMVCYIRDDSPASNSCSYYGSL